MRPLGVASVAILIHASLAAAPTSQAVYRAKTDAVVIDAAVTDGGRPVAHLKKDDFELRDNGVVQQILEFNRETLPLDMTVTIDISGSMRPSDRVVLERALVQVSGALRPVDRAAVVTFGSRHTERVPLQYGSLPVVVSGAGVGSDLLDALLLSLVTPPVVDRRQFVLVMTDGADNASFFDGHTVMETAKHASAPVAIVLIPNRSSAEIMRVLRSVAKTTGGEIVELKRTDSLSNAFLTALESFRASYTLMYSPTGVATTGWHEVSVTVKPKNYGVRSRRGYWSDAVKK